MKLLTVLMVLIVPLVGLATARHLSQDQLQGSASVQDPMCVNTIEGDRQMTWQQGGYVYPTPCQDGIGTDYLAHCEVFQYLGNKSVSTCGEPLCYRLVETDAGTTGWIINHSLGQSDNRVNNTSPDACPQPPQDDTCKNSAPGLLVYGGQEDMTVYETPCGTVAPDAPLTSCQVIDYLGIKQAEACGGTGQCFLYVRLASNATGWVADHVIGQSTSNFEGSGTANCSSKPTTPHAVDYDEAQVALARSVMTDELQAALQDDASTRAYFQQWMTMYGAAYDPGSDEYAMRLGVFRYNLQRALQDNAQATTYVAAPNAFSNLTWDEFSQGFLGTKGVLQPGMRSQPIERRKLLEAPPDYVNWAAEGKVSPVGDQKGCGSCWAFAALHAVESQYLISGQQISTLAVQELVDCLSHGCGGGDPALALRYVYEYGVLTDSAYPYTASPYGVCDNTILTSPAPDVKGHLREAQGFKSLPSFSATALMEAVAQQPTVVLLNVAPDFGRYGGAGIFQPTECAHTGDISALNHAVLVVGYNRTGGYWVVKNSWDATWGLNGYILMPMEPDGEFGACSMYSIMMAPAAAGEAQEDVKGFFDPLYNGLPVDWCVDFATDCGKPAADFFCTLQGYKDAKDFQGPVNIPPAPTFVATVMPKSGAVCSPQYHGCDTFAYIECQV